MSASQEQQERIRKTLSALWERSRPQVAERVAALEHAAESAAVGLLAVADRRDAGSTAHKLAGSVGMFGYIEAGELARRIEQMLEGDAPVDAVALRELTSLLRTALGL